jgi:hypothetical protein
MRRLVRLAAAAALATLAACGSGHTSTPLPLSPVAPVTTSGTPKTRTVGMTLTIPSRTPGAKQRVPAYVSTGTQSAVVLAYAAGPTTPIRTDVDLSATSPLCVTVSGGRACTFNVAAPIQAPAALPDTFTMKLYSDPCTGGPPCTVTANPADTLSVGQFTGAVTEGTNNIQFPLILQGVPATESLSVGMDPGPAGAARTVPVTVTVKDASGNIIIGSAPYANSVDSPTPIAVSFGLLTHLQSTGDPSLMLDGVPQNGPTVDLNSPADTLTISLAASQANVGVALQLAGQAPSFLHIAGGSSVGAAPSFDISTFGASSAALLAAPPIGASASASVYAASGNEVIPVEPYGTWSTAAAGGYCNLPPSSTIGGIAVASDGSFYATYAVGGTVYLGHFLLSASGNTPCTAINAPVVFSQPATLNAPGPVAIGGSLVFAISNLASGATTDVVTASTDLTQSHAFTLGSRLYGATATADGKFWTTSLTTNQLIGFTNDGAPGDSVLFSGALPPCSPGGVASDGVLVYVACGAQSSTIVATPNGTSSPSFATLTTAQAFGGAQQPIAIGPDGRLWIVTGAGSVIDVFDRAAGGTAIASAAPGGYASSLVTGGDGDLWFSVNTSTLVSRLGAGAGP